MSKKKRNQAEADPNEIPANWNNPFVGLKIDFPKEEPPPPPPPSPEELKRAELSSEDLALLEAFGGDKAVLVTGGSKKAEDVPMVKGRLSFNIQRKGKGGKTVTLVHGLQELELLEQMTLCSRVKNALGCGARFENGVLEIQGDQRQRAQEWFAKQGFKC